MKRWHPGNFLFRPDGTVGVLDFGCTKKLNDQLYEDYFLLADPNLFDDTTKAKEVLLKLEILRPTDSPEREAQISDLFQRLISLIAMPYHEGRFYFNNQDFYHKITDVGKDISKLREVRGNKDFLFINRTYYGLYSLFQQLDVELDTECKFKDFKKK